MKNLLKILAICAALITVSSCFTTLALTGVVLSNIVPGEKVTLSGRTSGQIGDSNQCALMTTDSGETVCIVYDFGTYKDGKRIKGRFVRAGMYRYENENGTELYAPSSSGRRISSVCGPWPSNWTPSSRKVPARPMCSSRWFVFNRRH